MKKVPPLQQGLKYVCINPKHRPLSRPASYGDGGGGTPSHGFNLSPPPGLIGFTPAQETDESWRLAHTSAYAAKHFLFPSEEVFLPTQRAAKRLSAQAP